LLADDVIEAISEKFLREGSITPIGAIDGDSDMGVFNAEQPIENALDVSSKV